MNFYFNHRIIAIFLGLSSILAVNHASASPIDPGFDLMSTPEFLFNIPGIGDTEMQGVAFGPGNTDTIVERKSGIDFSTPDGLGGFLPTGSGITDIELVALSLRSVDKVFGPAVDDYLWIIVNDGTVSSSLVPLTDQSASSGQMEIFHEFPDDPDLDPFNGFTNQGTVEVGTGALNDFLVTAEIWSGSATMALVDLNMTDTVIQNGSGTWSHTEPVNYATDSRFPAGKFYVELEHTGPHPPVSAVPEPTSLALMLFGASIVSLRFKKRAA